MSLLNRKSILKPLVFSLTLLLYACGGGVGGTSTNATTVDIVDLTDPIPIGNAGFLVVTDDIPVNWMSLNPSVATVSPSGLVSGVGIGTANIVATDINDPDNSDTVAVFNYFRF